MCGRSRSGESGDQEYHGASVPAANLPRNLHSRVNPTHSAAFDLHIFRFFFFPVFTAVKVSHN